MLHLTLKNVQHFPCEGCLKVVEAEKMDSKLLVKKTLAGSRNAFESIIRQHQRLVSHIVFRMVSNTTDREDVCQDIFLKVYQHLGGFQFESKLSTWIARISYNTCLNYLEKKKVPLFEDISAEERSLERLPGSAPGPDRIVEDKEVSSLMHSEIEKLPVHYRAIITMYHIDRMSYREMGEVMGLPQGTVKSHLFRARKLLKERLTSKYQPEDLCYSNT
jgi:RNA polymerase sigma factor (sigma-70 family)